MQFAACTKRTFLTVSAGDGGAGLHLLELTEPQMPPHQEISHGNR
jgi:Tfp pilus tip-associated adhesin PilY1